MAVKYHNGQLYDVYETTPGMLSGMTSISNAKLMNPDKYSSYSQVNGLGWATPIGMPNQSAQPVTTKQPYKPNQFTQGQLAQFNNGQRGDFENNPAYQQYVAKMNNMYGVSQVGAAGDVLSGQTIFPAGGKTGPTNTGSNT